MKEYIRSVRIKSRKKDLEKIHWYATKCLNLKIELVSDEEMGTDAGGYIEPEDGKPGTITVSRNENPTQMILVLIHEIGHHIDFLKRGYIQEEHFAYGFYPEEIGKPCPPEYRAAITRMEEEAIKNSYELVTYLDLKIPEFTLIKDQLIMRNNLKYILQNGMNTKTWRRKNRQECHKQARKILNEKRKRRKNCEFNQ